ncbi:MAG: ABC transporter ATP-binding protein [Anaerolineaceae bacterium]|nr:ABC transporter ATP-binding protein [Anaerolineaceae bacterium]
MSQQAIKLNNTLDPNSSIMKPPEQLDEAYGTLYNKDVVQTLWGMIRPYFWRIFVSLSLNLLTALALVAGPYFVKMALDDGIAMNDPQQLLYAVMGYVAVALTQWLSTYSRFYIMSRVGQSVIYDFRKRLFAHIQVLSLDFFNRFSVGRVITRVINDVNVMREFIIWSMLSIFRDLFILAGIIIVMLSMNVRLSLISFTVIPIMIAFAVIFHAHARKGYQKAREAMTWVNSVLAENINAVRVVQSFAREHTNYAHFNQVVNKYNLDANMDVVKTISWFFPAVDFLASVAMGLVIWFGGAAAIGNDITPGILAAFVLYINRFFDPIRDLTQRYDNFERTMTSGERVVRLLQQKVAVEDAENAIELAEIKGKVIFEDVSFRYEKNSDDVLSHIQLDIKPGQMVAMVGETGAGKSTLVKLLSRFIDPVEGRILLDDMDIRTVTQHSLRKQMGIVLQDPFLFSDNIRENIRFGKLDATDDEVEIAAKAVGAHDFIMNLNQGYDTAVGEGGGNLSVGQRQLISFARALIADPKILILDEATSSIDAQTEIIIQKALQVLLEGRTSFAIAHRLSTIVNADVILVMDHAEIIERGTHDELLAQNGMYARLYEMIG